MRPSMLGKKPAGHGPASVVCPTAQCECDVVQQRGYCFNDVKQPKKLTFNQWWAKNKDALQLGGPAPKTIAYIIWLEAQKNA